MASKKKRSSRSSRGSHATTHSALFPNQSPRITRHANSAPPSVTLGRVSPTVAHAVKRFKKPDKAAHEAVGVYVHRYMANRGLTATFPRLVVGMMAELDGWPVRNADGGPNVSYFTSPENAESSIHAWDQLTRSAQGI